MTLASRRLAVLIAVLYSTWLVAPLLDPQLHPWTSYASEYFVADRPAATLLRTTDGISGMLLIVMPSCPTRGPARCGADCPAASGHRRPPRPRGVVRAARSARGARHWPWPVRPRWWTPSTP